jgi:hypothetical protein
MSHRWSCPSDWEARREGERAFENGRSMYSNPYEDSYWNRDNACREAAEEWERGHRRAEIREEERREEEAAHRRASLRRAEEEAEEAYYYERQAEYEHYAAPQEEPLPEEPPVADAVDPHVGDSNA